MARRRHAELLHARDLSPSVRSLWFRTVDHSPVGHVAGQYVDLIVSTARGLAYKRSYSIASAPEPATPDQFEIAVTRIADGVTSLALHGLQPGGVVELEGPSGTFVRRSAERSLPALFVATGTGLAPIRAILSEERRETSGPPLLLLFGCRTPADILWRDELDAWQRECPRLRVHVTLSRAPPEWSGLIGYVQRHARALAESLPGAHAYVCGIGAMVDDVVDVLAREAKLPREVLHYETYD